MVPGSGAVVPGCAVARWGKAAHLTFFFFCILTNILVTSMLLLGGAAVINALTGMNIYAVRARVPSRIRPHACKPVLRHAAGCLSVRASHLRLASKARPGCLVKDNHGEG